MCALVTGVLTCALPIFKFRQGCWAGANLFWLANDNVKPLLNLWRGVEQDRKKGMKIVAAFGPLLLAGALLRLLTIQQAVLLAGRRFGVKAHIIPMPPPEACIDVDKPERSEEHTSELQSLMRISYSVLLFKKKNHTNEIQ